jgi:hypothetical protein
MRASRRYATSGIPAATQTWHCGLLLEVHGDPEAEEVGDRVDEDAGGDAAPRLRHGEEPAERAGRRPLGGGLIAGEDEGALPGGDARVELRDVVEVRPSGEPEEAGGPGEDEGGAPTKGEGDVGGSGADDEGIGPGDEGYIAGSDAPGRLIDEVLFDGGFPLL